MALITPVILCGGSGTRLWPLSRKDKPKPFHILAGSRTMLGETLMRCVGDSAFGDPIIIGAAEHEALIAAELAELGLDKAILIVEPVAKNTAPAIALAAALLPSDAVMLVCPSDHHIAAPEAFRAAAKRAAELASGGSLVSFGITPTAPETGYGYLKHGPDLGRGAAEIERFIEKPELDRAVSFLAEGGYSWNGGIFAFAAGRYLEELAEYEPVMAAAIAEAIAGARHDGARVYPLLAALEPITGNSVDYAVMERSARVAMVEADMGWSDIGNWEALRTILPQDENGNAAKDSHELVRCTDTLVVSDGPRVSAIGLNGVSIIVHEGEVVVIGPGEAQAVGKLGGVTQVRPS